MLEVDIEILNSNYLVEGPVLLDFLSFRFLIGSIWFRLILFVVVAFGFGSLFLDLLNFILSLNTPVEVATFNLNGVHIVFFILIRVLIGLILHQSVILGFY